MKTISISQINRYWMRFRWSGSSRNPIPQILLLGIWMHLSLRIWWGKSPSFPASLRRFLVTLAFPAAWLFLRAMVSCSRIRWVFAKTRGQSESARGAVPRVLRGGFLSLPSLRLYWSLTIPRLSHPVPWFSRQEGQNWRNGKKTWEALKIWGCWNCQNVFLFALKDR